ncbi:hypothetical protein VULLAG_LOCUS16327 [Vulpes lagopus]
MVPVSALLGLLGLSPVGRGSVGALRVDALGRVQGLSRPAAQRPEARAEPFRRWSGPVGLGAGRGRRGV